MAHDSGVPDAIPFRTLGPVSGTVKAVLAVLVAIGVVAALHATNADWAWSIRRFALGGATFLPISFILLFVVLIGGHETYFHHWLHVEGDPVIEAKSAW